ncbi:trimethylamine methyltransferase family protein [Thalassobaculum salexigens]|uniref:trimethylamine methyltransferase family protein n=1 Tax=Thalassobaculum salexigens TaxID=455360 RepID=UPI0004295D02|nr:trimethylamine methyltransferase family protein [Thalassobaculum salexigens]
MAETTGEGAAAEPEVERGRRGRGGGRRSAPAKLDQPAWRRLRHRGPPARILSDDALESIHEASLTILEEIGIDFLLPDARDRLAAAGATVQGERVRFDRTLVMDLVAKAPSAFDVHSRTPERSVRFGGDEIVICSVASAPNVSDLDGGRRVGNREDYRNLLKLAQSLNAMHALGGYPVEPVDIHASVRHLEGLRDMVTLTDRIPHAYSLGRDRIEDGIEIVRLSRGVDRATLEREPSLFSVINASSPLRYDTPMLEGVIALAESGQVTVITPFTLAGAMAPVTIAGALAQQNAEALAGIAFSQVVRPGAPVVYGGFTSNVDMKSGAPAFGTPEYMQAAVAGGQLARRYDLPYRSSNVNAANVPDAQAAWESAFSLWGTFTGGVNLLMHGCGWMEGGLTASFEKMVMDADMIAMVAGFLDPLTVDDASLALDAVREVGPGGHFFGTAHTQERYRTAFFAPMVSDWRNFETWDEAGAPDALTRANGLVKRLLAEYEEPPMDPAIREALDAFVDRRIAEGGTKTDF